MNMINSAVEMLARLILIDGVPEIKQTNSVA
jgi:hypothetical protein